MAKKYQARVCLFEVREEKQQEPGIVVYGTVPVAVGGLVFEGNNEIQLHNKRQWRNVEGMVFDKFKDADWENAVINPNKDGKEDSF